MTTKEEVKRLYYIWKFCRDEGPCYCEDHGPENFDICKREQAWRAYCKARDEYLGDPQHGVKRPDLREILDLFDSINS